MNETMKAEDAKKVIAIAIDREVEAYTFYRGVPRGLSTRILLI